VYSKQLIAMNVDVLIGPVGLVCGWGRGQVPQVPHHGGQARQE
jgi:hypothetical protein